MSASRVVVLAVVICLAVAWASHPATGSSSSINIERAGDDMRMQAALVLTLLATGPLLEEALLRGYMLGRLRRSFSSATSVLVSGSVVAVARGDPTLFLPHLVAGIVLGTLVVYTGRLWLAVVAHVLVNAVGLIEHGAFISSIPARLGIGFPLLCLVIAVGGALGLHHVLTRTRWSIPIPHTARVARPLTWGLDAMR